MKSRKGPVTEIREELGKLRTDVDLLKDDLLRSLAEFDNYRRRKEKEFAEFRELANERLLQELIPVLDNFERALQTVEASNSIEGVKQGVKLIYGQLRETLAKAGFQEYSCVGEEFDPRRCEAVNFVETDDEPENKVVTEIAKGYLYQGRVLRPALVTVAKPKSPASSLPAPSG